MSYEKQTWQTGDTITAEKLNHIEDGIANSILVVTVDLDTGISDVTYEDLQNATFAVMRLNRNNDSEQFVFPTLHEIGIYNGTYYADFLDNGPIYTIVSDTATEPMHVEDGGGGDVDPTITA